MRVSKTLASRRRPFSQRRCGGKKERMVDALNTCSQECPKVILRGVRSAVDAFVSDAEQFDDLTMLCIEYHGKEG